MSTERDAGLRALQQGNYDEAISLLETACRQNPDDFDAFLYLGAAYGQAKRQMDAINTITKAVQLRPGNAQARYNLGIAMDQGGYREQAIQAVQQAITLQPDYPKAQQALRQMQGAGSSSDMSVQSPQTTTGSAGPAASQYGDGQAGISSVQPTVYTPPGAQPPLYGGSQSSDNSSIPPAVSPGPPQVGFGQIVETPGEGFAPSAAPVVYGQPENASPSYGSPYARPETPLSGYGQPPPNPYGAPPVQQRYQAPGAYNAERPVFREIVPDSFNLLQAAKDWVRVIISPLSFFESQIGREGMLAPFALFLLYCIPYLISALIPTPLPPRPPTVPPALYEFMAGNGKLLFIACFLGIWAVTSLGYAWCVHLVGQPFGNSASLSASYRAVIYSIAPLPLLALINTLAISVGGLSVQNLLPVFMLIEYGWVAVLFCIGLHKVQQISVGAAIGVFLLSFLAFLLVFFGICFAIGIAVGIVIAVAASGHH